MHLERLPEISIYLDQRPGELAGLIDTLKARGVEIRSLAVSEHQGRGLVRLIGEPIEPLRQVGEAIADRGLGPVIESEVLAVDLDQRPGILREFTAAVADHGFNVRYAYLAPAGGGRPTRLVLRVDEIDQVIARIGAMDWPTDGAAPGGG